LLLQENPQRAELIDLKSLEAVALIDLVVEGRDNIARAWRDPKGSRGEGAVFPPGGHLLVAKEKKPAVLIEFGPPHSRSRGLVRGGALADGKRWSIRRGRHRFVALAIWLPDKTLAKTCADFSDLVGFNVGNWPTGALLAGAATESFARTMLALLDEGRPFTDALTTRRFMMNPPLMSFIAFTDSMMSPVMSAMCWTPGPP